MNDPLDSTPDVSSALLGAVENTDDIGLATSVLRGLLSGHEYPVAAQLIESWGTRFDRDAAYLKTVRAVQGKMGNLSQALLSSQRLAEINAAKPEALVNLQGRVREMTGPRPRITGPVVPIEPATPHRVVHLVKESRPYLSNGFTSRSHNNFVSEVAAGLEPIVITEPGFPKNVADGPTRPEMRLDNVGHYHLDMGPGDFSGMPADRYLQLFADMAYERVTKIRPAVLHASSGRRGYETALVGLAVKDKTGLPLIYEVRSFFESNWTGEVRYEASGEIYESRRRLELECMQRADLVLTIGEAMRQDIISRGIPTDKVGIIPNGVNVERFTPQPRDEELSTALGLHGVPTFGYVSNMDHHRESQETLINSAAHLARSGSPLHCVLVGDGPRRVQLERLADSLGVSDRVHFTGKVDHNQIPAYYSLIDIFVVPRTKERAATYVTPLKPFEAMAMGLPVVVSDLPALTEIATPPTRGWSFPVDSARDLAQTLEQIRTDDGERTRRAQAGLDWVRTQRQWEHNGPRYRDYINELTGHG